METPVQVRQLMTKTDVQTCTPDDCLDTAARLLWEGDIGVLPVVSGTRTVGVITDRDICMAAYTQGRPLRELQVASAMSRQVYGVRPETPLSEATLIMREHQVRRLPVLDQENKLVGLLSLNDLARDAARARAKVSMKEVAETLAAVCERQPATRTTAAKQPKLATARA
jgi:CBS domain-containing protein